MSLRGVQVPAPPGRWAARFVNWLQNGQPVGPQDVTTENGTYFLDGTTTTNAALHVRQPGAKWVLPTKHEWYKAAYYDTATDSYWTWPTHPTIAPSAVSPPGAPNSANAENVVGNTTLVGVYVSSVGVNGTFDMGGNVQEQMQAEISNTTYYGGGTFFNPVTSMRASNFIPGNNPANMWFNNSGLCIAFIPEPGSRMAMGALVAWLSRRRRAIRMQVAQIPGQSHSR